jgi:hypothetical protein
MSIIIVACVIKTGDRKYKNISHLGWITSMLSWSYTILVTTFLLAGAIITNDLCSIYIHTDEEHSVANFTRLWPADIQPLLDNCMFGSLDDVEETSSETACTADWECTE